MKLYHGSNILISHPDLTKGKPYKDFGRGFYTTRLKSQAQKWANLVASRKKRNAQSIVSSYECDETKMMSDVYVYKNFPT